MNFGTPCPLVCILCEHPVLSERIVMTPKKKTATSTSLAMERKRQPGSAGRKTSYVAGGEHQGIVINKVPQEAEIIRV